MLFCPDKTSATAARTFLLQRRSASDLRHFPPNSSRDYVTEGWSLAHGHYKIRWNLSATETSITGRKRINMTYRKSCLAYKGLWTSEYPTNSDICAAGYMSWSARTTQNHFMCSKVPGNLRNVPLGSPDTAFTPPLVQTNAD